MKYLPSILSVLVLVAGTFAAPVQSYVSAHPLLAIVLSSIATIVAHFSPSPASK